MNGHPTIKASYLFPNGMVATFDHRDDQVPYLQGTADEVLPKLKVEGFRPEGVSTLVWAAVKPCKAIAP